MPQEKKKTPPRAFDYYIPRRGDRLKPIIEHLKKKKIDSSMILELCNYKDPPSFFDRECFKKLHKGPVDMEVAMKLFFTSGIHPEDLFMPPKEEEQWIIKKEIDKNNRKYFTRIFWNLIKDYHNIDPCIDIPYDGTREKSDLIKAYEKLTSYIQEARTSIAINELTFKGNNLKPGGQEEYYEAQRTLLDAIYQKLDNDDNPIKSYIRYFHLSTHSDDPMLTFLLEVSDVTLAHVIQCLTHPSNKAKFYISNKSWYRSHCIIDDKYLITEDYVRSSDVIKPRTIFVDNVKYKNELFNYKSSITKDDNPHLFTEITLTDLENNIRNAIRDLDGKLLEIELRVKTLEKIQNQLVDQNKMFIIKLISNDNKIKSLIKGQKKILEEKIKS